MNSCAGKTDLPDFESGPFSHLGTSPYMLTRFHEVNAIFNFIRILIRTQGNAVTVKCLKTAVLKDFRRF